MTPPDDDVAVTPPADAPTGRAPLALVAGLPFVLVGAAALLVTGGPAARWVGGSLMVAAVAASFVLAIVLIVRTKPAARRLGMTHNVAVLIDAAAVARGHGIDAPFVGTMQVPCELTILGDAIRIIQRRPVAPHGPLLDESVELAAVRVVRVRPACVEIEASQDGALRRVRIAPSSFAARSRLLWELAVRCPDAMERGLPPDVRPVVPAAQGAPRPASSAASGVSSGAASATPDAAAAMADLDARMGALGSSLVHERPTNPAPPRSGLGSGLFAAGPADDPESRT